MSSYIIFNRLPDNDLGTPEYHSDHAAAIDFRACLKRPCRDPAIKHTFRTLHNGERSLESGPVANPTLDIDPGETVLVPLGWRCEFGSSDNDSERFVLQLFVRSSIGVRGISLANSVGIIDQDYRGELFAALRNNSGNIITIEHGERIVQGVLLKCEHANIMTGDLSDTVRGAGGFGSTGKV